jgi:hypothetical protein
MNITVNTAVVAMQALIKHLVVLHQSLLLLMQCTGGNWTGGAGSFNPNRNTANATYIPASGEIGTTITLTWNVPDPDGAGPCTAATRSNEYYCSQAVVANAGADQTSCGAHQSLLLLMQLLVATGQVVRVI